MKNLLQKTVLLLSILFTSITASAYDFEVDGIYYSIESISDLTVAIAQGDVKYEGDFVIPTSVKYNNRNLSVISIGKNAFYDCNNLTSVTIPNSVTSIGVQAFYECSQLKVISLHEGLEKIGKYCFAKSAIEELIIPNSVTYVETSILSEAFNLKKLQIGSGLNDMGTYSYGKNYWGAYDSNLISSYSDLDILKINDSDVIFDFKGWAHTWSEQRTYLDAFTLKEIYIGRPLTWGSEYNTPFENMETLNKIEFGGFCEENYKLTGCTALKTLILGKNIKNVYTGYIPADSLTEIYVKALVPPTVNNDFDNKIYINTTLYVPKGTLEAYQAANKWKNFWNIVEYDYSSMSKVETVSRDNVSVTVEGSSIMVNSPLPAAAIDLYDLSGRLLYHGHDTAIDNLTGGIYIVKLLGKTFKVAVK